MKQHRLNLRAALVLATPAVLFGGAILTGCGGLSSGGNGLPTPTPGPTPTPVPSVPVIAFASNQSSNTDIYLTNPGGTPRRLTSDSGDDVQPDVSKDSKVLLFASNRSGNFEIYSRNVADSLPRALTSDTGAAKPIDDSPVWSFDGSKIAWRSTRGGKSNIWTMGFTGANQVQLTNETVGASDPAWSPDGTRLAYIAIRGGTSKIEIRTISGGAEQVFDGGSANAKSHPRFSPDGTRLVYSQSSGVGVPVSQLRFLTVAGGAVTSGPNAGSSNFDPNWSPDGTRIIWAASGGTTATPQIFTAKTDGTDQQQITTDGSNSGPSWGG